MEDTSQLDREVFLMAVCALKQNIPSVVPDLLCYSDIQKSVNKLMNQPQNHRQTLESIQQQISSNIDIGEHIDYLVQDIQKSQHRSEMRDQLDGSNIFSPQLEPGSMISSTSIISTTYQRPTSTQRLATNSPSIIQAKNVTKRQEIDRTTLMQKIQTEHKDIDAKMKKLSDLNKQIEQRQKILKQLKQSNISIVQKSDQIKNQTEHLSYEILKAKERETFYKKQIELIKQKLFELSSEHPEYQVQIRGKNLNQMIENLFSQLVQLGINRIYEASKQGSLKVYEQETEIVTDNTDLFNKLKELEQKKKNVEADLNQYRSIYHQTMIDIENQRSKRK
ncbi:Conserved_hypothetical protein [Hexamita inflata]|uniref:Uncharacterized protein n=1 Tax=Hexamita inflata TaxID=28002 RepID=A0AA86PGW0_9EUKA|nr:Conserved hypothetical protein [Hexamita inflata]